METEAKQGQRAGKRSQDGLETHLGYWLRRVSNHVSGGFARALQAQEVSVAEWVALRLVHDNERLTPGQLSVMLGMTRGAVSKVLDKLERKKMIGRATNQLDNRVQWLSLTRLGRGLVPKLSEIADRNDKQCFAGLAKDERVALMQLLQKLTNFHGLREVPVD